MHFLVALKRLKECDTERPRSAMSLREILTLNYEGQQNIYGICHEQSIPFKGGAYLVKRRVTYSWWYSHEKKDSEHTIESEKNFKRESADGF